MSSGNNVFESLFKLWASICKMILDGAREAEEVAKYLQRVNDDPNFLAALERPAQALVNTDTPADGWASEWTRFYGEVFGRAVDLSKVAVPVDPGGFGWPVFVAAGFSLNQVWAKCRELFPSSSVYGDDLDSAIPKNDRTAENAYAKRFRNRVEADEENRNLSANAASKRGIHGITLLERFLLELWYCWRTGGGHLDLGNWTLCAGSRAHGGPVPYVSWHDYRFQVSSCHPDYANDSIRSRSAV